MNQPEEALMPEGQWLEMLCPKNPGAQEFVRVWARYCHEIDDIIDGDRTDAEAILGTFALGSLVYSHPFYLANVAELRPVVLVIANMFADSVGWERSDMDWQRQFSDCYRHCGVEMVVAVSRLCGGWDHARQFSARQRSLCWWNQHKEQP